MLNNMDELTWYGKQSECETAAFGPRSLIEPLIQKVDLVSIINQHLPVDTQAEFDHGSILSLLVFARLYSPLRFGTYRIGHSRPALMFSLAFQRKNSIMIDWGVPLTFGAQSSTRMLSDTVTISKQEQ